VKGGSESAQTVRVVLAELPSMMAILIRAALDETGIAVEEASTYEQAVLLAASAPGIGVVIVPTASTGLHTAYTEGLLGNPSVRCLTVSAYPQQVDLFELRLLGTDVGRHGVLEAIQLAIARPATGISA